MTGTDGFSVIEMASILMDSVVKTSLSMAFIKGDRFGGAGAKRLTEYYHLVRTGRMPLCLFLFLR